MKKATKGNPLRTLLAACAALSIMMGGVASAAEKVIKLAHPNRNDAFDNPSAAMAVVFKNLVEAATNRTVRVKIFPEGQLGRDADIVQLVRKGAVQSAISSAGGVAPIYPLISVMDLPFAYRSISTTYAVLDGPFGQKLAEDIRRKTGVAVLGFGDPGGFFAISNSKRTIKSPEDMKGLKIRTMDLETHKTIVGTLGGEPISIAWSEVYTALGTGAADGQMNPIPIIRFARFEEVQSYLTLTNHLFLPYVWVINGKFLDELSAEERTAVLNAARSAVVASRGLSRIIEASDRGLPLAQRMEIHVLTARELETFRRGNQPAVRGLIEKRFGRKGWRYCRASRTPSGRRNDGSDWSVKSGLFDQVFQNVSGNTDGNRGQVFRCGTFINR